MNINKFPSSKNIHIIIGHRGTGKSLFLQKLQNLYKKKQIKARFFDLDRELLALTNKHITSFIPDKIQDFRKQEERVFKKILKSIPKNTKCFISVGAGFVFKKLASWHVIYLNRPTDASGRIFLDKPRLQVATTAFKEYHNLYKKRHPYYLKQADECWSRQEHVKNITQADMLFLGHKSLANPCLSLRLNPQDLPQDTEQLDYFLKKRLQWPLRFFELHDKTASLAFVKKIQKLIPQDKLLYSSQQSLLFTKIKNKKHWSWDLSLGKPVQGVQIITIHKRKKNQSLSQVLKQFSVYTDYHLKLAVQINNFQELKQAYDWYKQDVKNRSFLPCSQDGKWAWFRQAFGTQMYLNFIKEIPHNKISKTPTQELHLDQISLSQALPFLKKRQALAGVLGDPIDFSATPAEHEAYFYNKKHIPIVAIQLKEKDMNIKTLDIMKYFGFVFFAVTSPLKQQAYLLAKHRDKEAQKMLTANTLIFYNKRWNAFNTDLKAMQKLKIYSKDTTAVWGGGGIRPVLKKYLTKARFYSARTGKQLYATKSLQNTFNPKVVIWAVGRNRMKQACLMPPKHWKAKVIIDINYSEDSPGKEYALQTHARYINGMQIFKDQARQQRYLFNKFYKS